MISKRTVASILKEVREWAALEGVSLRQVLHLFRRLSRVQGNNSFRDSIEVLLDQVEDVVKKESHE